MSREINGSVKKISASVTLAVSAVDQQFTLSVTEGKVMIVLALSIQVIKDTFAHYHTGEASPAVTMDLNNADGAKLIEDMVLPSHISGESGLPIYLDKPVSIRTGAPLTGTMSNLSAALACVGKVTAHGYLVEAQAQA